MMIKVIVGELAPLAHRGNRYAAFANWMERYGGLRLSEAERPNRRSWQWWVIWPFGFY